MENKNLRRAGFFLVITITVYLLLQIAPMFIGLLNYTIAILIPFIIAGIIAFVLHTLVDRIESYKIPRLFSVAIVFAGLILVVVFSLSTLIPLLIEQFTELGDDLPSLMDSIKTLLDKNESYFEFLPEESKPSMDNIQLLIDDGVNYMINKLIEIVSNFIGSIGIIVLTPIITFYLLYEYNILAKKVHTFLNERNLNILKSFLVDLDVSMGAYFRGLILVMAILSLISSFAFMLIGVKYPFLFGILVGLTNIIPIIGPYIGGAVVALYALTESVELMLSVVVVIIIIQLLESNILTPYVQSKSVNSHPLLILFAFLVFGRLFGFFGMIFAIPMLGIVLLIIKYSKVYYRFHMINKISG